MTEGNVVPSRNKEHERALLEMVKEYKPLVDTSPEFGEFVKDTIDSFASVAAELNDLYADIKHEIDELKKRQKDILTAMELMNEAVGNMAEYLAGVRNVKQAQDSVTN